MSEQTIFNLDNYDDTAYNQFVFFWRTESQFSQWHHSVFQVDGVKFVTAEQFMMYEKAKLFGDKEIMQKVLITSDPRAQKSLGRQVKNFDEKIWEQNCLDIVYRGNVAKFSQNENLKNQLINKRHFGKEFVEASPYDCLWGIGLEENDLKALSKKTWRGKNWLGKILTVIRDEWLNEE